MAGVSNLSMVVEVTNIEDSVHGRQSPYVYFWGTTYDRILMMKKYIESIRNSIENRPPPTDVKELSGVFCVLIFHEWRRAKVLQPVLSHTGTLEVFLIDYGHSHTARLVFLRTLDIPGTASEYVREMPDLATKYLLADVLAPPGCDSPYYWSEPAMMYLKLNVNDRPWKATSMGMCCGHQCLRLFTYANDHLLATLMIEQGLGVPSHTYKEALSMCNILQEQSSSTFLAGHKIDNKESGECGKQSLLVDSRDDYSLSTGNEDTLGPLEYQTVQQVEKLPTSLAMLDTDIFPLVQISGLPKLNATDVRNISPKLEKVATAFVTEIPRAWLASEEKLYVTLAQEAGSFFGQLEKNPLKDLDNMKSELMVAYSSDQNHPLLYADANSHLGHYGVVYWDEEDNFYRIRVIEEFINDAKVKFIDYGNCRQIPRCKILAPLESLSCFRISPFGIDCKMDDVPLSLADWSKFILKKKIRVKIGKCVNEVYSVTLTDELCNKEIAEVISSKTTPTCTSIPACSIRDCTVAVENVVEQTTDSNNDRLKRNSENSNFGKNRYVHPNADDDNKKTSGVENVTQSGNVKLSRKGKELIRSPRGSPLSTGNGEMKGPLRSLKPEKVEERTPNPLIQPGVQKSISVKQQPQQALPEVDSRVEDLCQLEVMDIDQLPVVKKESAESDSDHSKRKKNSSKCGKSRYVQPNGEDSNKKTSGAEHITKSGQGKASSKDCNPGPPFYQAQEVIRNPQGSPLSTGNGEMKGPLRSQKPEKVEERTPNPLIQPGVEISPPAENSELSKLPPTSAVPKPQKIRKDLLAVESVLAKNGSDKNRLKRNIGNENCGKSHYVLSNTEHSNSRTGGAEDECETVNMDAGPSTISEALLKQSSPSTVEEDVNKIISSTGDSTDVFVPCVEFSSICPSTLDAHGTLAESKAEGTIEEFPLLPVIYFAPGQKMSSYAFSSHIESATEIWIQLDPTAVDSLMAKIAEMDVSQLETPDLQLHTSCLALFPDDGRWYRALINSIDVNEAKVTFVDYGKSSLVNVGDLRVLPSFLTQTSGLALKCALDGTQQNLISSPTSDQCESIIAQEVLTVVFAGRSSGHLYVRLLDPSGLDLNEKLGFPESFSIESVASNLLEFNPLDDVEMSSPVARTADPDPLFNIDGDATLPLEVEDVRGVTAEPIVVIPTVLGHSENEKAEMVVNQTEQDVAKENEFYQCFSDSVNSFVQESIMEPRGGLEAKDVSEQLAIRLMSYQAQEVIRNPRGPPSTGNGEMKGPLQSQRPEKVEERSPTPLFQPDVEISPTDMLSELPKPQPISAVQQPRQAMPVADCRVEDLSDPGAGTASKVENLKVTKSAQRNKKRDNKRKVVVGVVPRDGSHMEEVLCEHLFDMNIQEIDRVSGHNSGGPSSGWSV